MLDFDKLEITDVQELQSIISKNVEKSELEKSYLYTHDTIEKARIYIWCFRFLYSIKNLTKPGNLKDVLNQELEKNTDTYIKVADLLYKCEHFHFNRHKNLDKLRQLILIEDEVDDMIDAFAVLLEKSSVLSMSRLKGFVLEGQSGKDFKRLFDSKHDEKIESDITKEEIQVEEVIDPPEPDDEEELIQEVKNVEYPSEPKQDSFDIKDYIGEGVLPEEYQEEVKEPEEEFNIDDYFVEDKKEEHHVSSKKSEEDIEDREQ